MKRTAGTLQLSESAPQICKRPKREKIGSTHKQTSDSFQLAGKSQTLICWLKFQNDQSKHRCVKQVVATFCLQRPGQQGLETRIGYLIGQTIDRELVDSERPGNTLFVSEMLKGCPSFKRTHRPMHHGIAGEDETELIMQHVFHSDGTPREEYALKSVRGNASLHFIAEFELDPAYRGCGVAKTAIHTYLRGLQNVGGGNSFKGTVLLSPAALAQHPKSHAARSSSNSPKTLVEIEHALIASYEKAGFGIWSKGDDSLRGSAITIMGMKITGKKFRKLRTYPLFAGATVTAESGAQSLQPLNRMGNSYEGHGPATKPSRYGSHGSSSEGQDPC